MSDLNEEDIAEYQQTKQESKVEGKETGFVNPLTTTTIAWDLWEWSSLVTELSEKESILLILKTDYNEKEVKVLSEFDFKKEYGKDNEKIRKGHIRKLYGDLLEDIEDLELSIKYLNHRINYLKSLIRVKSVIMEVKE